ncbi:hypothetical protein WSM22_36790 [Cytophagales bacterium WSM2-2]|nr:hypothetical protein WSM22_36790 [Cytophagales bacterium WSM2-2]
MTNRIAGTQVIVNYIRKKDWDASLVQLKSFEDDDYTRDLHALTEDLQNLWNKEESRNWISNGLLSIGTVGSQHREDFNKLAGGMLHTLAKYIGAQQGALYKKTDDGQSHELLELIGGYACDRQMEKTISSNEGLIGQSYRDGKPAFLMNIPANFIKINSGLGEATPRCVAIIPLIRNTVKIGVMELAFLRKLQSHEQEFLLSVSEVIAGNLDNMLSSVQTKVLLSRAESMTVELRSKEQEMSQTIQELTAIREDLAWKNEELIRAQSEIDAITQREKELIESKLSTQQIIHDKVVSTFKRKVEALQAELKRERELNPLAMELVHINKQLNDKCYDAKTN